MTLPLNFFYLLTQGTVVGTPNYINNGVASLAALGWMSSGINLNGNATTPDSVTFPCTALSEGWADIVVIASMNAAVDAPIFTLAGPTTDLFRIDVINTSHHWKVKYWDGGAWVQIGSTITATPLSTVSKITVRYKLHGSTGEFIVKQNGTIVASLTGANTMTTADTEITKARISACATNPSWDTAFYGVIIDNVDTVNLYVDEKAAATTGTQNGHAGIVNSIDEIIAQQNDSDFIQATADGQIGTWNFGAPSAAVLTWAVEGVIVHTRCKAVSDPGLYLQGVMRKASVNYNGDNFIQPAAIGFANYELRFQNNPETALPWLDAAAVGTFEIGTHAKTTP